MPQGHDGQAARAQAQLVAIRRPTPRLYADRRASWPPCWPSRARWWRLVRPRLRVARDGERGGDRFARPCVRARRHVVGFGPTAMPRVGSSDAADAAAHLRRLTSLVGADPIAIGLTHFGEFFRAGRGPDGGADRVALFQQGDQPAVWVREHRRGTGAQAKSRSSALPTPAVLKGGLWEWRAHVAAAFADRGRKVRVD